MEAGPPIQEAGVVMRHPVTMAAALGVFLAATYTAALWTAISSI